jgi:hypothetical protein
MMTARKGLEGKHCGAAETAARGYKLVQTPSEAIVTRVHIPQLLKSFELCLVRTGEKAESHPRRFQLAQQITVALGSKSKCPLSAILESVIFDV